MRGKKILIHVPLYSKRAIIDPPVKRHLNDGDPPAKRHLNYGGPTLNAGLWFYRSNTISLKNSFTIFYNMVFNRSRLEVKIIDNSVIVHELELAIKRDL